MRSWKILLCSAAGIFAAAFLCLADSYYTRTTVTAIPSVRISVDNSQIAAGDMIGDDAFSVVSVADNEYYELVEARFIDSMDYVSVGDTPRIRLYLNAYPREKDYANYTKIWLFQGGYPASRVSVSGGTFVRSSIRDSGYTLEVEISVRAVKGTYEEPTEPVWIQKGLALWNEPEFGGSGIYDVTLLRNGTTVKRISSHQGTSFNFFPYMTREGSYSFRVRTAVPENSGNGVSPSQYVESEDMYLDSTEVSDGSGQSSSSGVNNYPNGSGNEFVAGWITDTDGTYFRYPDGRYAGAGWLALNGSWYLLDAKGKRLYGWQKDPKSGLWYYMDKTSGIMKTGWLNDNGLWYWLNTEKSSTEGAMATGWRDLGGLRYFFNQSGVMVTGWYQTGGRWYYFYPQGTTSDGRYGHLAVNTMIGVFRVGEDGSWQN